MAKIRFASYDKPRRCPMWNGQFFKYPPQKDADYCSNGFVYFNGVHIYDAKYWKYRTSKCDTCGTVILPYVLTLAICTPKTKIRDLITSIKDRANG